MSANGVIKRRYRGGLTYTLESRLITAHCAEILPYPLQRLGGILDTDELVFCWAGRHDGFELCLWL